MDDSTVVKRSEAVVMQLRLPAHIHQRVKEAARLVNMQMHAFMMAQITRGCYELFEHERIASKVLQELEAERIAAGLDVLQGRVREMVDESNEA
jgi:uncharacterized protein (DUF1778 family)